ncbi:hypothetical protein Q8W80_20815 [Pseudomonas aeruginosa]|uniref:hypothetical protein n=1 Tax=Pseudomonas TaxID=286 RepID=UPI001068517F|nr:MULTISPECIES: hypothetical protein [Pseudomonas]MBW6238987.1 hypothetical protein [Pseudomonas aeruginosa]MDU0726738.1 hypothetical protein [Pseudomonas aeruginosa]TER26520.1 hypothetical protein IPC38_19445 [Pseudomonas aeruginosa]TER38168.1 hypothetical protein IPC37_26390 [Pseudomonas aeruginosa]
MKELFEVIFEGVKTSRLFFLLKEIESKSDRIFDFNFSEDFFSSNVNVFSELLIDSFLGFNGDLYFGVSMEGFSVKDGLKLPVVLLRVLKYEGGVDVGLCFYMNDFNSAGKVMLEFQKYMNGISADFGFENFYGGLEPASDQETRFFTNNRLGPLL